MAKHLCLSQLNDEYNSMTHGAVFECCVVEYFVLCRCLEDRVKSVKGIKKKGLNCELSVIHGCA